MRDGSRIRYRDWLKYPIQFDQVKVEWSARLKCCQTTKYSFGAPTLAPFSVLYEDNHLLVVNKSAGVATMGSESGIPTVARSAAGYLKRKYDKPGNVFVGVVSRLDRLVSGVLVLARTSKSARRLSEQIRDRSVQKRYLAWVEHDLFGQTTEWSVLEHWVRKNDSRQRMEAVQAGSSGAQHAKLRYRVIESTPKNSLVEVDLLTGRKHQIRLQFSELGHPILGDRKYGSQRNWNSGIALHSFSLQFQHPTRKEPLRFWAPPQSPWPNLPSGWLQQMQSDEAQQ